MTARRALALLLVAVTSTGCIGARFGARYGLDGAPSGVWIGPSFDVVVPTGVASEPGALGPFVGAGYTFAFREAGWDQLAEVSMGGMRVLHWPEEKATLVAFSFGFDGASDESTLHFSGCVRHGNTILLGGCLRFSPWRWFGADVGISGALVMPPHSIGL